MARWLLAVGAAVSLLAGAFAAQAGQGKEIRSYQGKDLSPFNREYDNSIAGPQKVDRKTTSC